MTTPHPADALNATQASALEDLVHEQARHNGCRVLNNGTAAMWDFLLGQDWTRAEIQDRIGVGPDTDRNSILTDAQASDLEDLVLDQAEHDASDTVNDGVEAMWDFLRGNSWTPDQIVARLPAATPATS